MGLLNNNNFKEINIKVKSSTRDLNSTSGPTVFFFFSRMEKKCFELGKSNNKVDKAEPAK